VSYFSQSEPPKPHIVTGPEPTPSTVGAVNHSNTSPEREILPGDQFATSYTKTPKSLYCKFSDITDSKLKVKLIEAGEHKEIEYEKYHWSQSGSIVFKNTEAYKARRTSSVSDFRKVVELLPFVIEKGSGGVKEINTFLQNGYELFGKDFASSVVAFGENNEKLAVGLVKKQ